MIKLVLNQRSLAIAAVSIFLISCASNNEPLGQSGYHSARAQATLEIPPDLVNSTTDSIKQPETGATSSAVLPDIEGLEIKGAGIERFLSVSVDADQAWAKLLDFASVKNLAVLSESKREGILETDWMGDATAKKGMLSKVRNLFSGSLGRARSNDKYKFWIERLDEKTTAIHVEHAMLVQRVIEPKRTYETTVVRWEQTPGVELKVVSMLRNMKTYFSGGSVEQELHKVQLVTEDAEYIKLSQPFDQAWAAVGQALAGMEYRLVDTNREKDLYLIKQSKQQGLLSKLTYKRKWGIKVEAVGDASSHISVTTAGGRSVDREDALPILYALTGQLRKQ